MRCNSVRGVAWTLADLVGRDRPDRELVETALFFRDRRSA
jgi:magnesium chelatase family protein